MLVVSTVASPDGTGAQKITKIHEEMYICSNKNYTISREIPGTPNNGTPVPILLLPYHSHKNPLKYGNGMGSL